METTKHPPKEELSGYALQALDPEEARAVEQHLLTCPTCRETVGAFETVADGLLFALPPKIPPERVRARLKESLAAGRPVSASDRPRFRFSVAWTALAAVTVLLLAAVVVLTVQVRDLRHQQAVLLQMLQNERAGLALVSQKDVIVLPVSSGRVSGNLVISADNKAAALFLEGLPALDPAHTYQVWLIPASGSPLSVGLFQVVPGQPYVTFHLTSASPIKSYAALGITIEPRGGSRAPTTTPVLVANF